MSVTVMGDAFIDIIVPVQGIKPGETYHKKILMQCGGTASVAVKIAKLGEKAKFVGKVGNDIFGNYFRQNLKINNVEDLTFVDDENPTGLCTSLVYGNGERAMVANRGANDYLKKEEVRSCIDEITNSKIVYFSGYSLLSRRTAESVLYAIDASQKQNCEIYFNPGAPNLIKEDFRYMVSNFINVLVLNIEEAKSMTKKDKIRDIAESINSIVDAAVITIGEEGCITIHGGGKYTYIKTEKLNALDTTGAGDMFSAGFIVGKLRGMEEEDCSRLGNETATNFLMEKTEALR